MVGSLSNGKDMRRNLISPFSTVQAYSPHGIDRKSLVRVYSNTEQPRVGLYINIISIRNVKHVCNGGISSKPWLWYAIMQLISNITFKQTHGSNLTTPVLYQWYISVNLKKKKKIGWWFSKGISIIGNEDIKRFERKDAIFKKGNLSQEFSNPEDQK